mgnify:CR=1 FL=1
MVTCLTSCFARGINMSNLSNVIVGNVVIHPALVEFLKRSHYFMKYDQDKETITLSVNDGDGGKTLIEIRNASHENAVKLAEKLDLKSSDRYLDHACFWSKYYEVLHLYHNGSEEAEWLRIEIFKLGIPCRVRKMVTEKPWALHMGQGSYKPPMWTATKVVEEIKRWNKDYQPSLDVGF